jgi:hypothetical protein
MSAFQRLKQLACSSESSFAVRKKNPQCQTGYELVACLLQVVRESVFSLLQELELFSKGLFILRN